MHSAGDKKLLAECFFIGIGQKMSYARAFFALLRLDRGVAVPKTGRFGTIMRVREIHLWAGR